jgi:hypothetical protein
MFTEDISSSKDGPAEAVDGKAISPEPPAWDHLDVGFYRQMFLLRV